MPKVRIISSTQKQSINSSTNDIANGIKTEEDRDKSFDSALKLLPEESTPDTSSVPIKEDTVTCICLPHAHSKNMPKVRIISSTQKQSINSSTNDIANGIKTEEDRDKSFDSALKLLPEESTPDVSS